MTYRDRRYNDHRASHTAHVMDDPQFGSTCVQFPYRGCVISLARDGSHTAAWHEHDPEDMIVDYDQVYGTSGESIREVMNIIDALLDSGTVGSSDSWMQRAVDYGELLIEVHDDLEYQEHNLSWDTWEGVRQAVKHIRPTNT